MGATEMLQDMKKSFNAVAKTSQDFIYFNCIEVNFLLTRNTNCLYIDKILSLNLNKGFGSKVLKEICWYADRHKINLYLEVKPFSSCIGKPPMDEFQLIQWYGRNGFEIVDFITSKGETRSSNIFIDMVRKPNVP